jgi:hypothetical protein
VLNSAYLMLKSFRGWLLASIFLLSVAPCMQSQDFTSPVSQFVAKIVSRAPSESASLVVRNRSSLSDSAVSAIRTELQRQLQARGWNLKKANPEEDESSLIVTLGENVTGYVWTGLLTSEDSTQVVFFDLSRPKGQSPSTNSIVSLSRTLLIVSDAPLLDITLLEGKIVEGAHLLALTSSSVQAFQLQSSQWHSIQNQPLGFDAIASRDLRGRIVPNQGSSFDAFLPGLHCTGVVTATLTLTCRQSDDPWPLADDRRMLAFYAAHRNYFNGVITGANGVTENTIPFYSMAALTDRSIYTDVDGHGRLAVPGRRPAPISERWGSSVAAIQSSCQGDVVVATSPGDFNTGDAATAFRVSGSEFVAASEPLSFSGPVVSLKSSTDHQQAFAVVASPSGRYEAYLLTARCGA